MYERYEALLLELKTCCDNLNLLKSINDHDEFELQIIDKLNNNISKIQEQLNGIQEIYQSIINEKCDYNKYFE